MEKSKTVTTESYTLTKKNGDWLGQITITSDGMISGVTDWGSFAIAWRACGDDFKKFLLSINQHYFASKLYSGMNFMMSGRKFEQACDQLAEKLLPSIQEALKEETIHPPEVHKVIELKKLLSRCEKTFGVLDELIETLRVCKKNDLPDAVKSIDIDFKLMQAEIKDTIR